MNNIENRLASTELLKERDFWKSKFSDFNKTGFYYDSLNFSLKDIKSINFKLDADLNSKLLKLSNNSDNNLHILFTSIFAVLLNKYLNQNQIIVGCPIDIQKNETNLLNTFLPLKFNFDDSMDFKGLLMQAQSIINEAIIHQNYPIKTLIDELFEEKSNEPFPLFDSALLLTNIQSKKYIDPLGINFVLSFTRLDQFIEGNLFYNNALFNQNTIIHIKDLYLSLAELLLSNILVPLKEISLFNEHNKLSLQSFNQTQTEIPEVKLIHQYFEKQVLLKPKAIALSDKDTSITYEELNRKAEFLAEYLVEHGLTNKAVVAILIDNSPELIISILAILKSGGIYLPIDVNYPEERIKYILKDSNASLFISQNTFANNFELGIKSIDINQALSRPSSGFMAKKGNNTNISPDDPAYIIYTSGSTGFPKGVIIKHESVVNYINWAVSKYIMDRELAFPLFTSASFDLTVTSIYCPLFSGNRILIYNEKRPELLFSKMLNDNKVGVIKLTPSHLKILIESDFSNTSLKCLVLGGEDLETDLCKRVIEKFKNRIEIYNEYGPTEATVGCMIYKYDIGYIGTKVPIGKPIDNDQIFIIDKENKLVPKGFQGEIGISGIGNSIGYLNKPELTHDCFVEAPFDSSISIYKTGDLAKWADNENLVFCGRNDDQVKLNGYRIEIKEIENQIRKLENIEDVFVNTINQKQGDIVLCAYYKSSKKIETKWFIKELESKLPKFMVPTYFMPVAIIPINTNGKVDVGQLPDPHIEYMDEDEYEPPTTETEKIVAKVWSDVLGRANIGINDDYFALGGDSIKVLQIVNRMLKYDLIIEVEDIYRASNIKNLCKSIKTDSAPINQMEVTGRVALSPIQKWFLQGNVINKHHFNQSVMLNFTEGISGTIIRQIFSKLQEHHDSLRMVFKKEGDEIIQENMGLDFQISLKEFDLSNAENEQAEILAISNVLQSEISLEHGPLMKLGLFHSMNGSQLLIVIHHLVIDGVSWRILFEDIDTLLGQFKKNEPLSLPLKTHSYQSWSQNLLEYIKSGTYQKAEKYWDSVLSQEYAPLNRDYPIGDNKVKNSVVESFDLSKEYTSKLLFNVHDSFNTKINDILLTALLLSIKNESFWIDLEGHGRNKIVQDVNINRTIGWFTSIYPVLLKRDGTDLSGTIKQVKELLRQVPNNGIDYLMQKFLAPEVTKGKRIDVSRSQICFNYLGQFDTDIEGKSFRIVEKEKGNEISAEETRDYDWEIIGLIRHGQLQISLTYSKEQYNRGTIEGMMYSFKERLQEIIDHCSSLTKPELTPSDLTYKGLTISQLDNLLSKFDLEDIYPLTPMQEGMLFQSLIDPDAGHYFEQIAYQVKGILDVLAIEKTMNDLIARHDILRTIFLHNAFDRPLQIVLKEQKIDYRFIDVQDECLVEGKKEVIKSYQKNDLSKTFDLGKDVLIRLAVLQTATNEFEFIWSFHHILIDGWSLGILHDEFIEIYNSYLNSRPHQLLPVTRYAEYIKWLENKEREKTKKFWIEYLNGYEKTASIPKTELAQPLDNKFKGNEIVFNITKEKTDGLIKISQKNHLTIYTILKTIWGIILGRYNNTNDVVFGSVETKRPPEIPGIESMMGLFINTVPIRIKYEEDMNITELFIQVAKETMNCEDYSFYSLADIQTNHILQQNLLDHLLGYENYPITERIGEISKTNESNKQDFKFEISDIEVFEQSNYNLGLIFLPGDELFIKIKYNSYAYHSDFIQKIFKHFEHIISQIIDNDKLIIKDISLLSKEDKDQLIYEFNHTKSEYQLDQTIHELFEKQVEKFPERIALSYNYDLKNIFEALQDEHLADDKLEGLGDCCFRKDKYLYQYTFDFDSNIILLKNHYHKNIIVNKNMLKLLNCLNEGVNIRSIYHKLSNKRIQFLVLSVSMDDLLEIRYGSKLKLESSFNDSYENFVRLFKLLYTTNFIDLVNYKSQDNHELDIIPSFDESVVEDTTYITDEIFSVRKDISPAKVLLLGDTPGMASIGILYLGSFLMRHGIKCYCQLFDNNCDTNSLNKNLQNLIDQVKPEIIGLSMKWFPHIDRVIETSKIIKRIAPEIKVVVGGNSASFYYDEVIKNSTIDYIIRGDGELPLLKLCQGETDIPNCIQIIDGKLIDKPVNYVIDNEALSKDVYLSHLDEILLSKYSSILGTFYIHTQKGCNMNCFFCAGCRIGQERTFNRKISYRRTVDEIRKDIIESKKYTSTFRFEFEDDNPILVKYCEEMWDGIDLTSHLCDVTHAYPPSPELIKLLNRTFKYVFWNLDLASLSEKHRINLYDLNQVKPQPTDQKIHECFQEWDKYDNCDVKINSISGLPYFTSEDIEQSEKLLIDVLNNYTSLSELHWGRLHAQPAVPIIDEIDKYDMVAHGHSYEDYLNFSRQNMSSDEYPTIEDYSYPYIYYKDDSFNSQITKHYAKMSHMIKQYAQSKRMKLCAFNHITYRELNEKANQLARTLISKGIGNGQFVGLMFESSIEMMISILAVLKIRGVYLPIDPTYPDSAIDYFIMNSEVKTILTQEKFLKKVNTDKFSSLNEVVVVDSEIFNGDASNLNLNYSPEDLAYLIYTSGTTGRPKGTLVEQKSITNYTLWRINTYKLENEDNSIQLLSYCFDGFGSNVYSTLLSGGTLVLIPESKRMDFGFIKGIIKRTKVTNISLVPSMFLKLVEYSQKGDLDTLRFIVLAGEKGSKELLEKTREITHDLLIINEYGPTEAAVTATAKFNLSEDSIANIGKPISNVKVYILDYLKRLMPINVPGELYIGGNGVARGYHNNTELSEEKFISNPYNGKERLYRTGDLVRWLPDGNIEYLGRIDHQVKIRGFRIEPREIEKIFLQHEEIKEVVVLDKENIVGEKNLYAYIVPKNTEKDLVVSEIRKYLSTSLPNYMIPSYFIQLDHIPLNINGKVDFTSLKMIDGNISSGAEFISPQDSLEEAIVNIWKEVLGVEKVGCSDNFFDLGGNSLNILRVNDKLKMNLGIDIPIVNLFNYPTIGSLRDYLEKNEGKDNLIDPSHAERIKKSKDKLKNLKSKTESIRLK